MTSAIGSLGASALYGSSLYSSDAATGSTGATGTTSSSGTSSSTSGSTDSSSSASMLSPQAFLQLLVAQLQYQDPTNPTDTSTFMNQTAMLSQVQTMNSMSSTLSGLESSQEAQTATSMIGKQVTYTDVNGNTGTGVAQSVNLSGAGGPTLQVGSSSIPLSEITSVAQATSASS